MSSVQDRHMLAFLDALIANGREAFKLGIQLNKVIWATEHPKDAWRVIVMAINGLQAPLWEKVNETTIRVNLDAPPALPFDDAKIEWNHHGSGWVTVERRGDDLYVDGKKVFLHLVEGQRTGTLKGYELRARLQGQQHLHLNVLDALFENTHLIPKSLMTDEQGRPRFVYFWAVGFRSYNNKLFVRSLYKTNTFWFTGYHCLGHNWNDQDPAAVLEEAV